MNNTTNSNNMYIDEERLTALTLAVEFWGSVMSNPKSTPPPDGKVIDTAKVFYRWLTTL